MSEIRVVPIGISLSVLQQWNKYGYFPQVHVGIFAHGLPEIPDMSFWLLLEEKLNRMIGVIGSTKESDLMVDAAAVKQVYPLVREMLVLNGYELPTKLYAIFTPGSNPTFEYSITE